MALTPNVILHLSSKGDRQTLNLNEFGVISLEFERVGAPTSITGVLQSMTLVLFDPTGYTIMSYLQRTNNKLYLQYGFADNLSSIIELTVVKMNTSFAKGGIMVSLGAVGTVLSKYMSASREIFTQGLPLFSTGKSIENDTEQAKIESIGILRYIAERNGWKIRDDTGTLLIKHGANTNIYLPYDILNTTRDDYSFIVDFILPLANKTVIDKSFSSVDMYYTQWIEDKGQIYFSFQPKEGVSKIQKVWSYDYGVSDDSLVLAMTNKLDTTFLLQEIILEVPVSIVEYQELTSNSKLYKEMFDDAAVSIREQLKELNYIIPIDKLSWKPRYVLDKTLTTEEAKEKTKTIITKKINQIISTFNTMELDIVGNPKISPLDYVEINARNVDGNSLFVSSISGTIYWRVVKIKETINQGGYITKLSLVRSVENLYESRRAAADKIVNKKIEELNVKVDNMEIEGPKDEIYVGNTEPDNKEVLWYDTTK